MPQSPRNRPTVFLSHSKADRAFIERLFEDLRHCQVEPWLDSEEIRPGQPWLDAIFESGIPTCDGVLVYLTPDSIQSPMVKKEIDAAIIKKLRDNHIAFLPYVSDAKLRKDLRADIQALQTPEWNEGNYAEMLPRLVAEIWHSYLDRVVLSVSNDEKVKRLEAELELERVKKTGEQSVFDQRESADFAYIWSRLDRYTEVTFARVRPAGKTRKEVSRYEFRVHLQTLIPNLDRIMPSEYSSAYFGGFFGDLFGQHLPKQSERGNDLLESVRVPDCSGELLMYGLIQRTQRTESAGGFFNDRLQLRTYHCYVFTDKMYRFKYWLAHNANLPDKIKWEPCERIQATSETAPGLVSEQSPRQDGSSVDRGEPC